MDSVVQAALGKAWLLKPTKRRVNAEPPSRLAGAGVACRGGGGPARGGIPTIGRPSRVGCPFAGSALRRVTPSRESFLPVLQPALLLMLLLPFVDLVVLVRLGKVVGLPITLLYLGVTALLGLLLCKRPQLMAALLFGKTNATGEFREVPLGAVLACLAAGALLLFPGPLSDLLAGLLLIPPLRTRLLRWSLSRMLRGTQWEDAFESETRGYDNARPREEPDDAGEDAPWPDGSKGPVRDAEFEVLPRDTEDVDSEDPEASRETRSGPGA